MLCSVENRASSLLHKLAWTPCAGTLALIALCCALYLPGIASLPVTDRDEPRFAQATKQMLETGDFVDIRFQDVARHKKPVGIYWLQSIAVTAAKQAGASLSDIWAYRIPSFLGALGAVLALFLLSRPIVGREAALVAAALFAACFDLAFEAHIAKSDGALIATIVVMQVALFRLYVAPEDAKTRGLAALFWLAMGAGILIKGPINPALAILTAASLLISDVNRTWLRNLNWRWGMPLLLAVVLPWFIAIGIASKGAFFQASLGQDFAGKLQSGQEKHWGPPGFYFVLFWWTFWPAALFVSRDWLRRVWRERLNRHTLFLLAWVVPFWLVCEFIPTKLPHYALPLYPAVALSLASLNATRPPGLSGDRSRINARWSIGLIVWTIVALAQFTFLAGLLWFFEAPVNAALSVVLILFLLLTTATFYLFRRGHANSALLAAIASAAVLYPLTFREVLPAVTTAWISEQTLMARQRLVACGDGPVAFANYGEPSAVFLNGTKTILTNTEGSVAALNSGAAALAFVNWTKYQDFETKFSQTNGSSPLLLGCVDGFNVNGRGATRLHIYGRSPTSAGCQPVPELACNDKQEHRWRRMLDTRF